MGLKTSFRGRRFEALSASTILRELAAEKKKAFMKSFVGQPLSAITLNVTSEGPDGTWTEALSDNYLKMKVRRKHVPNRWLNTVVESVEEEALIGSEPLVETSLAASSFLCATEVMAET